MQANDEVLDDFRIIRADFKNLTDYSKIHQDSFKMSIRETRPKRFGTLRDGKIIVKYKYPQYQILKFRQIDI